MTATDKLGIVERLRDESLALQKAAWSRPDGGQECGISANLADEAAALLEELVEALDALNCSDILGVAESCASGTPRWDHVNRKITAARALLAKVRPR